MEPNAGGARPIDVVLSRLERVRRCGDGWEARCPAHEDRSPSLSIGVGSEDRVLLTCQAGCDLDAVVSAMGLTKAQLFATPLQERPEPPTDIMYSYTDRDGRELYQVVRRSGKQFRQRHKGADGEWVWSMRGVARVPYRLPEVAAAITAGQLVWIVEGEKDVHTLERLGLVATCNSGGAGKWQAEWSSMFTGADVVVLPDNDAAGQKHAQDVSAKLQGAAKAVRVLQLPDLPEGGDVSDWVRAGGDRAKLEQLLADQDAPEPEAKPGPSSWEPINLLAVLRGELPDDQPTLLQRSDGQALLYAGKVNTLMGEPETGKSLLAMEAARQEILLGNIVVYIDYEDTPAGIIERLQAMGLTPDQIADGLLYIQPAESLTSAGAQQALLDVLDVRPSLVVIDSIGEAFSLEGLEMTDNSDSVTFANRFPRLVARYGPCVTSIDHVAKDPEKRGRYGLGAQHKLAAVDGSALATKVVTPFGRGLSGMVRVDVNKDRRGFVRGAAAAGKIIAEAGVDSQDDGLSLVIKLDRPVESKNEDGSFRPTTLMERVSKALQSSLMPLSKNQIETAVSGKRDVVRLAIDLLAAEGYITRERGARGATLHTSVRAFEAPKEDG